jgi:hypothetical protein
LIEISFIKYKYSIKHKCREIILYIMQLIFPFFVRVPVTVTSRWAPFFKVLIDKYTPRLNLTLIDSPLKWGLPKINFV